MVVFLSAFHVLSEESMLYRPVCQHPYFFHCMFQSHCTNSSCKDPTRCSCLICLNDRSSLLASFLYRCACIRERILASQMETFVGAWWSFCCDFLHPCFVLPVPRLGERRLFRSVSSGRGCLPHGTKKPFDSKVTCKVIDTMPGVCSSMWETCTALSVLTMLIHDHLLRCFCISNSRFQEASKLWTVSISFAFGHLSLLSVETDLTKWDCTICGSTFCSQN